MAMSFLAIKYYPKMTRRRFVLAIYSYQVCIQRRAIFDWKAREKDTVAVMLGGASSLLVQNFVT